MEFRPGDRVTIIFVSGYDAARGSVLGQTGIILPYSSLSSYGLVPVEFDGETKFHFYPSQLILSSELSDLERIIYGIGL